MTYGFARYSLAAVQRGFVLLGLVLGTWPAALHAAPVELYTESYPPYSFLDDEGHVAGVAVQYVRQIMDETGLEYDLTLMPWSRAMQRAMGQDNALIFSMTRTPEREDHFDWIAYITSVDYYLFGRTSDDRQVTLEMLRRGAFRVVCLQDDISCALLRAAQIPVSQVLKIGEIDRPDVKLVYHGRADLYVGPKIFNADHIEFQGLPRNAMRPVFRMGKGDDMYLAAARTVRPDIRTAVRKAYEKLKSEGRLFVVPSELSP